MRDELLAELRSLRKGTGLTLAKLTRCPALLSLTDGDAPAAYELVMASVQELGDGIKARALANAFAIGQKDPRNLTQRRDDFGLAEGGRHKDTVESYENEMLEELVEALMNATQAPAKRKTATVSLNFHDLTISKASISYQYGSMKDVYAEVPLDHDARVAYFASASEKWTDLLLNIANFGTERIRAYRVQVYKNIVTWGCNLEQPIIKVYTPTGPVMQVVVDMIPPGGFVTISVYENYKAPFET